MRARQLNPVTLREVPADAEIASHQLLLRAGFIYKSGSGLYLYGHLLKRVLDKISRIIVEEITAAGGIEVVMPILQEQGLWEQSGRWEAYLASRTMLTTTDRGGQTYGLAPTAEEVVTDYAKSQINSYKQMPVTYFQQATKFRDEIRPRFGLMRVKEFIMMDAYSFHADQDCLNTTYEKMRAAYIQAFSRCGLEAFAVEADSGSIGGSASHEFMVAAEVGEDAILIDEEAGYAANVERAEGHVAASEALEQPAGLTVLDTLGKGGIDDVISWLNEHGYPKAKAHHMLKTVLFQATTSAGSHTIACYIRGDRDVNEVKLLGAVERALATDVLTLEALDPAGVQAATGARPGFAGPGLTAEVQFIDQHTADLGWRWVTGNNADDQHVMGLDVSAFDDLLVADLMIVQAGDQSPRSAATLVERRGIEVGHIFQLGTKYSAAMDAVFNGKDGKRHPFQMGCYGIGTSRVAAAAVEQCHDDNGIIWPQAIAPYHCVVVPAKLKDDAQREAAEAIYGALQAAGVEVLLDDRDMGPGPKFKDWDLIGIPVRVVCGRGIADGKAEIVPRHDRSAAVEVDLANVTEHVQKLLAD
jgi:prolyl-tRNA synthetase